MCVCVCVCLCSFCSNFGRKQRNELKLTNNAEKELRQKTEQLLQSGALKLGSSKTNEFSAFTLASA